MTDQQDVELFAVGEVQGRVIQLRRPTDGQVAAMARYARSAQRSAGDVSLAVDAVARMLDVLMNLVINEVDRTWLDDGMVIGKINLEDMTPLLNALNGEAQEQAPKTGPVKKAARAKR